MRSLIAVLAAGLLAIPPAAAIERGGVAPTDARVEDLREGGDPLTVPELTAAEVEGFRAAGAAAGLSDDEIDRVLADPMLLATTPLFFEVEEGTEDVVAMPLQPGLDRYGTHAVRGRTRSKSFVARTWFRRRIFTFTVTKYWEYDGRRVVASPPARAAGFVTSLAAFGGWRYHGVIGRSDHYVTYGGRWRGGHLSWRQAKFTQCAWVRIGCVNARYPSVTIRGHYDGSWRGWTG